MVFRSKGKRWVPVPVSRTTGIDKLPDEILLPILDGLSTCDLWALRLLHPSITPSATTLIQKRVKRLYVHPSITNIRKVAAFCSHPLFGKEVVEVVLLTKVPPVAVCTKQTSCDHDCTAQYTPWTGMRLDLNGKMQEMSKFSGSDGTEYYRPLIDALTMLPKFSKLSIDYTCREPGFCAVAESKIQSHSLKSLYKRSAVTQPPTLTQYFKDYKEIHRALPDSRSDLFMLLSMLSLRRPNDCTIDELSLRMELPHSQTNFFERPALSQSAEFSNIKSLTLAVDRGWEKKAWHNFWRDSIAKCKSLQRLRIEYSPNLAIGRLELETSMKTILAKVPDTLTRLEIAAFSVQVATRRTYKTTHRSWHLVRLDFDLLGFLKERPAMMHLTLDDVVLPVSEYERLITYLRDGDTITADVSLSMTALGMALSSLYEEAAERLATTAANGIWRFVVSKPSA